MLIEKNIIRQLNLFTEVNLLEEIATKCEYKVFDKGDIVVRQGQYIKVVPIVISGSIRVFQTQEDREILLYYVTSSQTCMMSLSACFYNNTSPSQAVAVEKTEALIVPTLLISEWQRNYASWNQFIIKTFRKRYDELLETFSSVAFDHIDQRILSYLEEHRSSQNDGRICLSHQELANELGTTRVVVSRILKQFEIDGIVKLHRGAIELN